MSKVLPKFFGTVENGNIKLHNSDRFRLWLGNFEGQEIELTCSKRTKLRSTKGNSFYWVYLTIISAETGQGTPEELHEFFKRMFLPPKIIKFKKGEGKVSGSTRDLSTTDFSEYLDRICSLCEVPMPNPDDYYTK